MSTAVDCKRSVEIEIPLDEVERARERVTNSIKGRVRLPGFRPGKAPVNIIQSRFESEIRNEVLELLLPQAFRDRVQKEELKVVGTPDISDLHFEPGQPIRFKADFEVAPGDHLDRRVDARRAEGLADLRRDLRIGGDGPAATVQENNSTRH